MDQKHKYAGLATLFNNVELKSLFINYLYSIIAVEILIFLVSFLGNLGPNKGPFPWKFYFSVAFIAPVAITFLLGVIILAFNQFIFDSVPTSGEERSIGIEKDENRSKLFKLNLLLTQLKKLPLLPILFFLVICSVVFYQMDAILLFIFNAGEKMATYLIIAVGVLLAVGLIFGITWIVSNYKLSKKHMEYEYRYRNDVMEKLGFLIMDDDTVIDKNGNMISQKQLLPPATSQESSEDQENLKILPPPN
jgi:hypothetical protein